MCVCVYVCVCVCVCVFVVVRWMRDIIGHDLSSHHQQGQAQPISKGYCLVGFNRPRQESVSLQASLPADLHVQEDGFRSHTDKGLFQGQ